MPPEAVPSNMKVTSKRATSIGAKVHEMQFILASASLECLFAAASDSRALPQTKGGKKQVRPVVHIHRTHREMLSEIVLTEDPRKHKLKFPPRKKKEEEKGGIKSGQEAAIQPRGSVHKISRELSSEHLTYLER